MKIDVNQTLKGPSGEKLTLENGKEATMGKLLILCLERNDPNAKAMDKYDQIVIAMRIADSNGEIEITSDQATKIGKTCEWLPPAFVYHIFNALDLNDKEKARLP